MIINRRGAEIQGFFEQFKRAPTVGSPLGCIGDAETNAVAALNGPKSKLGGVVYGNTLFTEQLLGKPADVLGWNPNASKPRVNLRRR